MNEAEQFIKEAIKKDVKSAEDMRSLKNAFAVSYLVQFLGPIFDVWVCNSKGQSWALAIFFQVR